MKRSGVVERTKADLYKPGLQSMYQLSSSLKCLVRSDSGLAARYGPRFPSNQFSVPYVFRTGNTILTVVPFPTALDMSIVP
jgi:hypothetical protein